MESKIIAFEEARPPEYSDESLALRFAERHTGDLRYVAAWGKWNSWDGKRWQRDDTKLSLDLARRVCRKAAAECKDPSIATKIASAKTINAVERLSQADRRLAASVHQWDADPWLLNTPDGVVDLRTGIMRPADPNDYLTMLTAVAPDPDCTIALFLDVIDRATGGDAELAAYLQRVFGYGLTGSTREHSLHFAYGTGANGKSTVFNAVAGCVGAYHRTAPIETFTATNSDRHPTELAMLRGSRLVTATETKDGRRWAESRIKTLTGGDPVSARFMRQDFFEFVPQFTLVVIGNHKPGLTSVDEAIRRRFHLIPFDVVVPPDERDPELGEKLKVEWPGILHWMVEGCLEWQRQGLTPPEAVRAATEAYLEAEDAVGAWLDENCEIDPNAWERGPCLFDNWKTFAEKSGEPIGNAKQFRDRLEARGISHKRQPRTGRKGYQGLKLKETAEN